MHETSDGQSRQPTLLADTVKLNRCSKHEDLLVGAVHKGSLLISDGHSRQPTLLMLTLRYLTDALAEPVNQFGGCSTNCAQPHTGSLLTFDGHSRQPTLLMLTLRYLTDALAERLAGAVAGFVQLL
jgi:hypothetical protein